MSTDALDTVLSVSLLGQSTHLRPTHPNHPVQPAFLLLRHQIKSTDTKYKKSLPSSKKLLSEFEPHINQLPVNTLIGNWPTIQNSLLVAALKPLVLSSLAH